MTARDLADPRGSLRATGRRWTSPLLATLAVLALVVVPTSPATAAASDDYQQVIDITFPFQRGDAVRYSDDYDDSRTADRHHQATDLMVAGGTPIYAARGGTIAWMSGDPVAGPPSYGWMLRIAGNDGRSYAYVHMGWQDRPWGDAYAPGLARGVRVERGQLLGWAGCSGSATCGGGEHLHFEIHDTRVTDPYDYHDHERINPYPSLVAAERRGDYGDGGRFGDVPSTSVHRDNIEELADRGITKGCGEHRFCPKQSVTRAQMASFLARALDLPIPSQAPAFTDVSTSNVHSPNIAALAAAGITKGCDDRRFCPDDPVTRKQMATFLVRALDLPRVPGNPFSDVEDDDVHAPAMAALAAAGVTRGCGGDRFCPDEAVTRDQMATFIIRALQR